MNVELKHALDTIKKYCEQPKRKSFEEVMENASLKQRIENLRGQFTHYIDHQTIWYLHNKNIKKGDTSWLKHPNYINVELSEKQRKDCLDSLEWFKKDIEYCIGHLKNK